VLFEPLVDRLHVESPPLALLDQLVEHGFQDLQVGRNILDRHDVSWVVLA